MTNAVLETTNSPAAINGLDVLDKVNGFYSIAFDHILWLLGTLILLLGIVVPVAFYFFQKRQLVLKEQMLTEKMEKEFEQRGKALNDLIKESFQKEKAKIAEKLAELEAQLKVNTAEALGATFHIQGNNQSDGGFYALAIGSYAGAIDEYKKAGNWKCVQQMLNLITIHNLPQMNKDSFVDNQVIDQINYAVSTAKEISCNGLLDVSIENLKKALMEAQRREPTTQEQAE
jgi:hypothetical protein